MKTFLASIAAVAALMTLTASSTAYAQKPVSKTEAVSQTFTITAIDHTSRVVTLKGKGDEVEDVYCGPEVQRFDALKVGDKVTFRYYESLVSAITKATGPVANGSAAVTRTPGATPGATIAHQVAVRVTLVAIDAKVPSVTVKTADGHTMSFKVEDKKNLEGFKVGDTVEITYTQALAISVTPAK